VGVLADKGSGVPMGGNSLFESISKKSRSVAAEGVGSLAKGKVDSSKVT
jgi:hypothetical protein